MSFTLDQLLDVFERYNLAIWPLQVIAYVLGIVALIAAVEPKRRSSRLIVGILAVLWFWNGIAFFLLYFGPVYTPAYGFGVLFIIQGILFLIDLLKPRLSFGYRGHAYAILGILFIAYAVAGYPAVGAFLGHRYPQSPTFGLTPCPLTVFTFGLFLLTNKRVPKLVLVIPLIWALGGFMPVSVGILEDIGLIVAGVVGTAVILLRDRKTRSQ